MISIRRIIKTALMTVIVGAALAVVIFGPRGAVAPRGRVVVEYWDKFTGYEANQMRRIVNAFNRTVGRRRHIFVRYFSVSDIQQKVLISTASGVPPDVAGMWEADIIPYAALGALTPLGKYAKQYGITSKTYLPVYWRQCHYHGHLYALVCNPMALALLYNKQIFKRNATKLRAAGLNPNEPPRTISQLDRYARVLTKFGPHHQLVRVGFLPLIGSDASLLYLWFGGQAWNPRNSRFTLTSPAIIRTYRWIASYSRWLGPSRVLAFESALGQFDSPQDPFISGQLVMEMQGPWWADAIWHLKPSMSTLHWPKKAELKMPLAQRVKNYAWAYAPFPSAVPGLKDVTFAGFDSLVIPRGARHPRQAFAFIAYVNRQKVMEHLCMMHSTNSPLRKVSRNFLDHSPNPYIDVFEKLARSPNAHAWPRIPIIRQFNNEMTVAAERVALLQATPRQALAEAQRRLQREYDEYEADARLRRK